MGLSVLEKPERKRFSGPDVLGEEGGEPDYEALLPV